MATENKKGMSGALIGGIAGVAQAGISMIGQRAREKRAFENQKELMNLQNKNQMGLNEQGQQLQMKTWEQTSYPAQLEMMKKAGLSTGLMYGGGAGSGGSTGSQGGGSAASGSAPSPQPMELGSAMQTAANIALLKAQKENIEADTNAKITGEAYQSGIQTEEGKARTKNILQDTSKKVEETNKTYQEGFSKFIENEKERYKMASPTTVDVFRSKHYGTMQIEDGSPEAEKIRLGVETLGEQLEGLKKENNIKAAELRIKEFEAKLADEGISSNSPYYIKLMTDILRKIGVLDWIKGM